MAVTQEEAVTETEVLLEIYKQARAIKRLLVAVIVIPLLWVVFSAVVTVGDSRTGVSYSPMRSISPSISAP